MQGHGRIGCSRLTEMEQRQRANNEVDRSMIYTYEREYMYRTHGQSGKQNAHSWWPLPQVGICIATGNMDVSMSETHGPLVHGPKGQVAPSRTHTAHKHACQHVPDAESVHIHTYSISNIRIRSTVGTSTYSTPYPGEYSVA